MVKVGPLCVDAYEASVWNTPAGAIYARSEAGETPSGKITWFQAQQACVNAGKRLPTNAEWQMA
ncbi:MAG: SUMF1/EgtB/PvdO family nonheme iron enzyme, partial [Methylococcales bacterium]